MQLFQTNWGWKLALPTREGSLKKKVRYSRNNLIMNMSNTYMSLDDFFRWKISEGYHWAWSQKGNSITNEYYSWKLRHMTFTITLTGNIVHKGSCSIRFYEFQVIMYKQSESIIKR